MSSWSVYIMHFYFKFCLCMQFLNHHYLDHSENPRDGGAWWAAIYGVAQSRTQLKRLSSSSSCQECGKGYHTLRDIFIHGKPRKKQVEVGRIRKQKEKTR